MTLAKQRRQFGEWMECMPSRFLEELPAEDVEHEGRGDARPEQNRARGRATLNSLKGMFDDL
jgi:ATP-dependent DNA helicase Rep